MKDNTSRQYVSDYTGQDESVPVFVSFAIEQYKHHKGIPGSEAMHILSEAGVLEHLVEYYDVMHQQSAEWLMEEIDAIVERHSNRENQH